MRARGTRLFFGVLACWLALAGCPGNTGPFSLFRYLPMLPCNTWSFGCAGYEPADPAADMVNTFTIGGIRVINGHAIWIVTHRTSSNQQVSYSPDTCYLLYEGILYSTESTAAVEDLPDSLTTAFTPFVHEDLTPRTIVDTADPLRQLYNADIRYVAGALKDFVPFHYVQDVEHRPTDASVELTDFGAKYQELADCVALEALLADAAGTLQWTPVLILGRGIGPLLATNGDGVYVTLREARVAFGL